MRTFLDLHAVKYPSVSILFLYLALATNVDWCNRSNRGACNGCCYLQNGGANHSLAGVINLNFMSIGAGQG